MILNINETKKISFDINVQGAQYEDLNGMLRIQIENIEYGFPVKINDNTISVKIPPLNELLKNLNDGDVHKAKLEIIAGDQYIVPWEDDITIEKPVSIKAEVKMDENIKEKGISIGIKKINEKSDKKIKPKNPLKKQLPKTKFGKLLS